MFRLTIILFLIGVTNVSFGASTKPANRIPTQDQRCPALELKNYQIEFAKPNGDAEPVIQVKLPNGKTIQKALRAFSPASACKKLYFFPERGILMVDYLAGNSGSEIVNQMTFLAVYRVNEGSLDLLAELVLENRDDFSHSATEPKPAGPVYSVRNTYTVPHLAKVRVKTENGSSYAERVVFEIKDQLTGDSTPYSY